MSPDWSRFAEKMAKRADSFLTQLPDDDFRAGMTELRTFAEQANPRDPVTVDVDFFVFLR